MSYSLAEIRLAKGNTLERSRRFSFCAGTRTPAEEDVEFVRPFVRAYRNLAFNGESIFVDDNCLNLESMVPTIL